MIDVTIPCVETESNFLYNDNKDSSPGSLFYSEYLNDSMIDLLNEGH